MRKHPNICTLIQIIQARNSRCEDLLIQVDAGASSPKKSTRTIAFQKRFETLIKDSTAIKLVRRCHWMQWDY
jgi:hypothetical protein